MKNPGRSPSQTTDRLTEATRLRSQLPVHLVAAFFLMIVPFLALGAQDQPAPTRKNVLPKRIYNAVRLAGLPPKIDGKLDDPCWTQGEWQGDFIQREPHEGQPGSQPYGHFIALPPAGQAGRSD